MNVVAGANKNIPLETYAEVLAQLRRAAGFDRARVLARSGLTPERWEELAADWKRAIDADLEAGGSKLVVIFADAFEHALAEPLPEDSKASSGDEHARQSRRLKTLRNLSRTTLVPLRSTRLPRSTSLCSTASPFRSKAMLYRHRWSGSLEVNTQTSARRQSRKRPSSMSRPSHSAALHLRLEVSMGPRS